MTGAKILTNTNQNIIGKSYPIEIGLSSSLTEEDILLTSVVWIKETSKLKDKFPDSKHEKKIIFININILENSWDYIQ